MIGQRGGREQPRSHTRLPSAYGLLEICYRGLELGADLVPLVTRGEGAADPDLDAEARRVALADAFVERATIARRSADFLLLERGQNEVGFLVARAERG
jgi:hypothetical protein